MSNDILKLDGISAWLASVHATKSLFCGYRGWREICPKLHCVWTARLMNRWHHDVLKQMEHEILNDGEFWSELPIWAKDTFNHSTLARINNMDHRNKATELHAALLVAASQSLLTIAENGAGQHNTAQIKLWFESLTLAKSLSVYDQADLNTINRLHAITHQYKRGRFSTSGQRTVQENGENKLYHEMVLIHVAHMVNFACTPAGEGNERKVNCSPENLRRWSVKNGRWLAAHLQLGSSGSCIGDVTNPVQKTFAMIKVPTDELSRDLQTKQCPNVFALHQEILERMAAAIELSKYDNPNDNTAGGRHFLQLQQKATKLLDSTHDKLLGSRKEWHHRLKHRNNDTPYEPRFPHPFMNDVFVMGDESYHHIFTTEVSPTKRKHDNSPDSTGGTRTCASRYAKLGRLEDIPTLNL